MEPFFCVKLCFDLRRYVQKDIRSSNKNLMKFKVTTLIKSNKENIL